MLTGQELPDEGEAYVAGHSVVRQRGAARRRLGYCPQFEALPGALTSREVLHMYARWGATLAAPQDWQQQCWSGSWSMLKHWCSSAPGQP
jgi:hypothetical protein